MKIKNWFKNHYTYFIPMGITLLLLLIAFMIKGVYPFGKGQLPIVDYALGLVPSYTHLWDFIHGKSNFFFNETLGLGNNMYASSVLNTFYSPLAYLVGLSSREGIIHFVNYLIVIKMMLMATTSYIVFKKWFKNTDWKLVCLFSLLWTFSSWLLVHVSNVGWLDVMIIFPFLIDSLKEMIEKGKMARFVFLLSLCLIFSYYMAYMILIMLIVGGFSAYFTIVKKPERKRFVGQLFLGTLFSLFISMFAFLPSFLQSQASYRFNGGELDYQTSPFYTKLSMLMFYGVLLVLPFRVFKKAKQDTFAKFLTIFIVLTILPVIIEPINKMWHTGSYFSYPFRYSFIPIFFLLIASLYYLDKYAKEEKVEGSKLNIAEEILLYVSGGMLIASCVAFNFANLYTSAHLSKLVPLSLGLCYCLVGISGAVTIYLLLKAVKFDKRKWVLIGVSGLQIFSYIVGYCGYNQTKYIDAIYAIKNNYDMDNLDSNYAIKDNTYKMMNNFPLILDHKSISTWLHINGKEENINAMALGYDTVSTEITSHGGTIFSDILSNTRYILTYDELDSELYNLLEKHQVNYYNEEVMIYLYEYKYNLPLSLVFDKDLELEELDNEDSPFSNQNYLYRQLFNKSEDLIEVFSYSRKVEKDTSLEFNINNKEVVYIYSDDDNWDEAKVYVNDKLIGQGHTNGIIDLGVYNNELVKIKIESENELKNLEIASIETSKIINLVNEVGSNETKIEYDGNKVKIEVNASKAGILYVPINYENGCWSAINNNKSVEVNRYLGTYLGIEVSEGNNEIVLTFTPRMLKVGTIITIATLVLVGVLWLINRKYKFFTKKGVIYTTFVLGSVFAIAIGSYVYLIPLMK